jgi:hypothetical protein
MMKKTTIFCIILCAAHLVCAVAVFGQTAVIRELSGTVELKRAGQTAFVPARIGDEVAQNTIVSTGFRSTALIAAGSSVITVRPLTRLSLAEISSASGTETINVSLQTGRVRVNVDPPPGTRATMSVRGPSATASVRGTSFEFDTRNLSVQSGVVAFRGGRGGVMLVSSGSTSTIKADEKAADPIETNALALTPLPVTAIDPGLNNDTAAASTVEFTFSLVYN